MRISDWSSDVCSSDLLVHLQPARPADVEASLSAQRHGFRGRLGLSVAVPLCLAAGVGMGGQPDRGRWAVLRLFWRSDAGGPVLSRRHPLEPPDRLYLDSLFQRRSEEHTSELQSLMRISYAV